MDPSHNLLAGFAESGGTLGAEWNSSQGFHNVTMALVSFALLLGSLRTNVLFVLVFFGLVMLFAFIAAADFRVATAKTVEDQEFILKLLKIGGGFGFIGLVCGWYLTFVVACESTGVYCPLPVFDLSHYIPDAKTKGKGKREEKAE